MFNEYPLNEKLYNGEIDGGVSVDDPIVFNNFGLSNENVVTSRDSESSPPNRELTLEPIPGDDGETIEFDRFPRKIITLRGVVFGATAEELAARVSAMKKALVQKEGTLKFTPIGGEPRFYSATLLSPELLFQQRTGQDITRAPFDARFIAVNSPFGRDANREVISHFGKTVSQFDFEIFNSGEYQTPPQQILVFDAASAVTKVNILNNTTGEEVEVSWSFSAGDILEINSEEKSVKINGVERDFEGYFWKLVNGANSIRITVTSTSHNYTYTTKFFKRYL